MANHKITLINLRTGEVEGHAAGCADIKRGKAKHADAPWTFSVSTKADARAEYNADFDEATDGWYDINWLPCADHVPSEFRPTGLNRTPSTTRSTSTKSSKSNSKTNQKGTTMNKNTKSGVRVTVLDGDNLSFTWTEKAEAKWGKRQGDRYTIGAAFIEADKAGREAILTVIPAGRVRRALMVVAKAEVSDAVTKAAHSLHDALEGKRGVVTA